MGGTIEFKDPGYEIMNQQMMKLDTSIENYFILQKIERSKELIKINELTLSEIAWKLNYSSNAHFSNQFKNVTGLTPTAFLRIINKRRESVKISNR